MPEGTVEVSCIEGELARSPIARRPAPEHRVRRRRRSSPTPQTGCSIIRAGEILVRSSAADPSAWRRLVSCAAGARGRSSWLESSTSSRWRGRASYTSPRGSASRGGRSGRVASTGVDADHQRVAAYTARHASTAAPCPLVRSSSRSHATSGTPADRGGLLLRRDPLPGECPADTSRLSLRHLRRTTGAPFVTWATSWCRLRLHGRRAGSARPRAPVRAVRSLRYALTFPRDRPANSVDVTVAAWIAGSGSSRAPTSGLEPAPVLRCRRRPPTARGEDPASTSSSRETIGGRGARARGILNPEVGEHGDRGRKAGLRCPASCRMDGRPKDPSDRVRSAARSGSRLPDPE